MCNCLAVVSRIFLGIISLLFTIIGFALLALGIIVKVQLDQIKPLIQSQLDSLISQAKDAAAAGGDLTIPDDVDFIQELLEPVWILLVVLGVILMLLGIFGLVSSCCMVKCIVIVYLIIVALLTLAALIIVIILVVDRAILTDPGREELTKTLKAEYKGYTGTDLTSHLWNVMMPALECCGVSNSNDFDATSVWYTTHGGGSTDMFPNPIACCKSGSISIAGCPSDNNNDTGCFDKLMDYVLTGTLFIAFACGLIGFFALLTCFSSVILHKIIKKSKEVQPI